MTEQELDLFMRNVLLDAIALDEERIFIGNFGRFPVLRCRIAVPT